MAPPVGEGMGSGAALGKGSAREPPRRLPRKGRREDHQQGTEGERTAAMVRKERGHEGRTDVRGGKEGDQASTLHQRRGAQGAPYRRGGCTRMLDVRQEATPHTGGNSGGLDCGYEQGCGRRGKSRGPPDPGIRTQGGDLMAF